jgi:hypothetical protein
LVIGTAQDDADDRVLSGRQARGERNGRAKLRQLDVDEIRRLYQAGGISQRALANQFSVDHTTVRDILSDEIWAAAYQISDRVAEQQGARLQPALGECDSRPGLQFVVVFVQQQVPGLVRPDMRGRGRHPHTTPTTIDPGRCSSPA